MYLQYYVPIVSGINRVGIVVTVKLQNKILYEYLSTAQLTITCIYMCKLCNPFYINIIVFPKTSFY